ncbi:D-amino acid dehydrogenase [Dactylosporangium sp. NPDC051484]|uniref:D-amino acid dehydrogenase n=1 Tax=Dactylosporangium sp. NPDC051484 TaxID=3154942 RepID=UPI00344E6EA5
MRIVVLGGGVIGVTAAYMLAERGDDVVLIERRDALAQETSDVNAGLIAPGHAFTWASPAAPKTLVRSLLGQDTSMRMHWKPDLALYRWGMRFLSNCTTPRSQLNTVRRLKLSQHSREVLDRVVADNGLEFHQNKAGALFLHRTQEALERGIARLSILKEFGEPQEYLDADQCAKLEPSLGPVRDKIAGAIYSASAMSGDSSMFANALAAKAKDLGVEFELGTTVTGFEVERGTVRGVRTNKGVFRGDAYLLCLGVHSRAVGRTLGLSLPIYPVKGYTLNAPVRTQGLAPRISGIDEGRLVAWSRFGDSIRMTGTADFTGYDLSISSKSSRSIFQSGGELFPESFDWEAAEMKIGLRPVTSNELPLIGHARKHPNVILNTGHGNLGWTMAAGSADIVADLLHGSRPKLDPRTFGIDESVLARAR